MTFWRPEPGHRFEETPTLRCFAAVIPADVPLFRRCYFAVSGMPERPKNLLPQRYMASSSTQAYRETAGNAADQSGITAMSLISISASGEVNLLTSTIVEAGSPSLKYSAPPLSIPPTSSTFQIYTTS